VPTCACTHRNLKLNARYYIDKQIVPALARVFGLIGVDVKNWYAFASPSPAPRQLSLRSHVVRCRYAEMPRSLLVNKSNQLEALGAPAPLPAAPGGSGPRASSTSTSGGITLGGIMPYERVNPNKYACAASAPTPSAVATTHCITLATTE
jgi:hypothetical protein